MFFPGSHDGELESPIARLLLGFAGQQGGPQPHLSVDGLTPTGPNLSHWPGNRTPPQWRADLSTGIALRFARAETEQQESFLGEARYVVNDHYDTDGFGALLTIMRPDIAFRCEELLIGAAGVGDFGTWHTWRAFAIDRIVKNLNHADSPIRGQFQRASNDDELSLQRYVWLVKHAESVLDHIGSYRVLYEEEMALVQEELQLGLGGAIDARRMPAIGFCAMHSSGPRHRMTINTLAGAYRVLHVMQDTDGTRYRYHDRTESWFDLVTLQTLPRRDLRPLCAKLAELEPEHDGASWQADAPTAPIPELYFGVPCEQEYGEITRDLRPSKLSPEQVTAAFAEFFGNDTN